MPLHCAATGPKFWNVPSATYLSTRFSSIEHDMLSWCLCSSVFSRTRVSTRSRVTTFQLEKGTEGHRRRAGTSAGDRPHRVRSATSHLVSVRRPPAPASRGLSKVEGGGRGGKTTLPVEPGRGAARPGANRRERTPPDFRSRANDGRPHESTAGRSNKGINTETRGVTYKSQRSTRFESDRAVGST